ncbi:uncharacterized protein LOC129973089 [Argiope bruennichi]|uniref:uncharacterized protein LOC129957568 n=1 Tax=Argiope bruennichi TaxID=94029 RepID=UPI0024958136|nr:uncharacterized protein LOC129957568 [Argiope bruennichi]XP_055925907.1 uncharacterized protein LOC129957568 [Argiope bruennichi]XP_055937530.1 uncharacterized protein LOC129966942 [Argiope bruennichi]XP_055937531.1 uncharacterized protein LOC129966942 [Argiope bruennichi]XP_055937532.1 uncharacterized protein LOC129966944 [Argiope bruennichi]XP_055937533.1 uncharacterized protein LOC129966944 [Argiope bruennichi]XP_055937540.1 uncharacterized protein LOC129966948 [Argiope bruennichi]XP_0
MAAIWMATKFFLSYRSNIGIDRQYNMAYIHVILLDKGTTSTTSSVAFCSMHLIVHPKYAGCEEVFLTGDVEGDETIQGRSILLSDNSWPLMLLFRLKSMSSPSIIRFSRSKNVFTRKQFFIRGGYSLQMSSKYMEFKGMI